LIVNRTAVIIIIEKVTINYYRFNSSDFPESMFKVFRMKFAVSDEKTCYD